MSIAPENFRNALRHFASGVTVVSCQSADGAPIGVTVSAFTSVSLTPPLILVCLDHATADLDSYLGASYFAVNILAAAQADISNGFAFAGDIPPFDKFGLIRAIKDVPVLAETAATLVCAQHAIYEGGDHKILVGEVVDASWRDDTDPLIYVSGAYRALKAREPL